MLRVSLFAVLACGAWAKKPHIFLVLVDDWGWNNAGFHNYGKDAQTPHIDKMVADGIRLDRHYTYSYCSPTRSSLQSGRLPVHVWYTNDDPASHNPADPMSGYAGIPRNMTGIAAKLRSVGYRTHMTGKWDAGMATWDHTPMGRGYETFFGYFHHANDYWNQTLSAGSTIQPNPCQSDAVDLWNTTGPAYGKNGTKYEEELFTDNTLAILDQHDPSEPLFLFHSFHIVHTPLQVPAAYEKKFAFLKNADHRKYSAMVEYMDESMGKFVAKLKEKNMWDDTLLVLSSDNGGPIYGTDLNHILNLNAGKTHGGASNRPLRGGKMSDFEGGIRVNAFASGGFIPKAQRGIEVDKYIHVADWYATFCHLASVDAADARAAAAGLPPIDSINQWPLWGITETPRTEIHISEKTLIQDQYKLLTGGFEMFEPKFGIQRGIHFVPMDGYWDGYGIESDISTITKLRNCKQGCLFDIRLDPNEQLDLAATHPDKFGGIRDKMMARLSVLNYDIFKPDRGPVDHAACTQITANKGFWGPWVDLPTSTSVESKFVV